MSRPRKNAVFELGGQWIGKEPGSGNFYRFWTDAGTGRTRRASLSTSDIESAKRKLAELIVRGAPKTVNTPLSVMLETYFTDRTDKKPSKIQSRNAGKVLLLHFGLTARVASLSEEKQKGFALACIAKGQKLSYVARNMTVLKAAVRHARIDLEVIYTETQMRERWGLESSVKRKARVFTDQEFASLWSSEMPENLRRFLLIQMATGGRPETAIDLQPDQRTNGAALIDLNPLGRIQNKKHRPLLREVRVISGWLDLWETEPGGIEQRDGRYCGYTSMDGVESSLNRAIARAGIPRITTYSFRHKVVTILRQARVSEDEIAVWMGHKRPHVRSTGEYGEWDPDYLTHAAAAIDAWFVRMQSLTNRPLFSQGIPETIRARMEQQAQVVEKLGAGEANRTPDPNLGKVTVRAIGFGKGT